MAVVACWHCWRRLIFTSGETVGSTGALRAIAAQPFGRVLISVTAFSLMGYVVWRFIQAFLDPEHNSSRDASDIVRRLSYACSGLIYAGVAYSAVKILTASEEGGGKTAQQWALEIMNKPLGRVAGGGWGLTFLRHWLLLPVSSD